MNCYKIVEQPQQQEQSSLLSKYKQAGSIFDPGDKMDYHFAAYRLREISLRPQKFCRKISVVDLNCSPLPVKTVTNATVHTPIKIKYTKKKSKPAACHQLPNYPNVKKRSVSHDITNKPSRDNQPAFQQPIISLLKRKFRTIKRSPDHLTIKYKPDISHNPRPIIYNQLLAIKDFDTDDVIQERLKKYVL